MYDAEPMATRNVKIQQPLVRKSRLGPKLHRLPMQLKIQIVLKVRDKRTVIKTMASHAILILRSLMTSLMNLVIFFISLHAWGCFGYAMNSWSTTSMPSIRIICTMVIELLSRQDLNSRSSLAFPHHYPFRLLPILLSYLGTCSTNATIEQSHAFVFYAFATSTIYKLFVHDGNIQVKIVQSTVSCSVCKYCCSSCSLISK